MPDADEWGLRECGAWAVSPGTTFGPYTWRDGWHSLILILDGSALVEAEGETVELQPNSVYCAPPFIEHRIDWDPRRSTRFGWANFRPADTHGIPRVRHLAADDIVISLLHHVLSLAKDRPGGWRASSAMAFDYVIHAYRTGHSSTRTGLDGVYPELVIRTIVAIQHRRHRGDMTTPSLDDLAAEVGVSRRHLCRVFDAELGVGPITVFRMVRILRAAQMLTDSGRTIREISTLVGFADPYHFARVFKATIGVPPGEYRTQPPARTLIPPRVAELAPWLT